MSWKTIAIIFIILFVLETFVVGLLFAIGAGVINRDNECSSICAYEQNAETYYYDDYIRLCSCFVDNEVMYEEVMK